MYNNEEWYVTTARQLRSLREAKELSYDKLSTEIQQTCGVSISADSLSNYEVTATDNHAKAKKVLGMKIEFLHALAQYYNVSTDYLLGFTNNKTTDKNLDAVCQYTGLSEAAISQFSTLQQLWQEVGGLELLNRSIEDVFWLGLMIRLKHYCDAKKEFLSAKKQRDEDLSRLQAATGGDICKEIQVRESGEISISYSQLDMDELRDYMELKEYQLSKFFTEYVEKLSDSE